MTDWNGLPPDATKRAFYWLRDNIGDEVPCLWIPGFREPEDGCWRLWGSHITTNPKDVAATCEYVAEVMTTKQAGEIARLLIADLKQSMMESL